MHRITIPFEANFPETLHLVHSHYFHWYKENIVKLLQELFRWGASTLWKYERSIKILQKVHFQTHCQSIFITSNHFWRKRIGKILWFNKRFGRFAGRSFPIKTDQLFYAFKAIFSPPINIIFPHQLAMQHLSSTSDVKIKK